MTEKNDTALVERLDSFDLEERRQALGQLVAQRPPGQPPERRPEVNMHCHTFFSYNAYGYSPSRLAWEAHRYGLEAAAIVDFDVLDGVAEFLQAARMVNLKAAGGFESRVFVHEYADKEINSPHEPGVFYLSGTGFTGLPQEGTAAAATLASMSECARRRNRGQVERINDYLGTVQVDYDTDVLPLTPAGNATERHTLVAYEAKAREVYPEPDELTAFWAEKLRLSEQDVRGLLEDVVELKNVMRARLMKHGGVGYAPPEQGSFPGLDEVVRMTLQCGAVPSGCWLDGTRPGEADPAGHFGFLRDKGIPTVTVIPDRNWNLEDPEERTLKVRNLHAALEAAAGLEMPVLVGTEMNKHGQKFVDTFEAPALAPYRQVFLDGAHVAWGHTLLKTTVGVGYTGPWSERQFGGQAAARNEFFRRVGAAPYPTRRAFRRLAALTEGTAPGEILAAIGA